MTAPRRVVVWDLPLRVFHLSLVLAVGVALITAQLGGAWMIWHGRAGIAAAGLLLFRLVWGVLGSSTARWVQFVPTAARLRAYWQGRWHGRGHNPLGALSVVVMVAVLVAQVATGLGSHDDIAFAGPLAAWWPDETVARLTGWHHRLSWVVYSLIGLHLAAVAVHQWLLRHDLIGPMWRGWVLAPQPDVAPPWQAARRGAAPLAVGLGVALVVALAYADNWRPGLPVTEFETESAEGSAQADDPDAGQDSDQPPAMPQRAASAPPGSTGLRSGSTPAW